MLSEDQATDYKLKRSRVVARARSQNPGSEISVPGISIEGGNDDDST
jgi:hypothetical protein